MASIPFTESSFQIDVSGGDKIAATAFEPFEASGAGVLYIPAYKSVRTRFDDTARELAGVLGVTTVSMDLSGNGDSQGNGDVDDFSIVDHLEEALAAYDVLSNCEGVRPARIGVVGASYGGYIALRLAANRHVDRLLFRAPALYPNDMDDLPRSAWDVEGINTYRSTLHLGGYRTAANNRALTDTFDNYLGSLVYVVSSGEDESIPPTVAGAYASIIRGGMQHEGYDFRHIVIPGARHSLSPQEMRKFTAHVVGWAADL